MPFATRSARRSSFRSAVASFAVAVALVGGASIASTAITSEVSFAQEAEVQDPSEGFANAYRPLAEMLQGETPDFEGVRAQLPALVNAIENNRDRDLAGNLILNVGSNSNDRQLQRQGLMLRLEGGMVAPERQGQFNWFVGSLSFEFGEWATARDYINRSRQMNFTPDQGDQVLLIALTHEEEERPDLATSFLISEFEAAQAAGGTGQEEWLLNALQHSYDYEYADQALNVSELLLENFPTQQNWRNALQIVNQLHDFEAETRVDLLRLMSVHGTLDERPDVTRLIEDLDPRLMSNEVQRILADGLTSGVFESTDPYYAEVRAIVETRAPQDRAGADGIIREARSGDALDAVNAGDVLLSLEDYARAETMYALALERGYDANTANTRMGITQVHQGNYAAAMDTFGAVTGERAPVARMWASYSAQMLASSM